VYSKGTLTLSNTNVTGVANAMGTYSRTGGSVSGGEAGNLASVPGANVPTKTFTCPTAPATNQTFNSGTGNTLAPGNYLAVAVNNWGTALTLSAGTYNLSSLSLASGTQLRLPTTGVVIINVCGRVFFGDQASMTGISSGSDALRLQVYSSYATADVSSCSAAGICLGDGGGSETLYGVFRAPSAGIRLGASTMLHGFAQGAAVYTDWNVTVNGTGITGANCIAASLGSAAVSVSGAPVCNATVPSTSPRLEDGTCEPNAIDFIDTTGCATRPDLAVNMPCDNGVEVCNHGGVDAPPGTLVTLYPRSGQQFAPNSPDPAWALDTCTVLAPIQAGKCSIAVCNATWFVSAAAMDLTIMVNAAGTTPLNECSLLDNWSLFDRTQLCAVATPVEEVQVYEARCPYVDSAGATRGSSPRWGTLSWVSDTPGTTNIRWDGRVAATATGFSGAYDQLAIANEVSGNEQCDRDSTISGCPVNITPELDLGQSVPTTCDDTGCSSFLEVRVRLNPNGLDVPTLRDWEITYSCVFDE
jgi:hypothetical protein